MFHGRKMKVGDAVQNPDDQFILQILIEVNAVSVAGMSTYRYGSFKKGQEFSTSLASTKTGYLTNYIVDSTRNTRFSNMIPTNDL
jgi:hypothetical protein